MVAKMPSLLPAEVRLAHGLAVEAVKAEALGDSAKREQYLAWRSLVVRRVDIGVSLGACVACGKVYEYTSTHAEWNTCSAACRVRLVRLRNGPPPPVAAPEMFQAAETHDANISGTRLEDLCRQKGLSLAGLARKLGIDPSIPRLWANGARALPVYRFPDVCRLLDVTPEALAASVALRDLGEEREPVVPIDNTPRPVQWVASLVCLLCGFDKAPPSQVGQRCPECLGGRLMLDGYERYQPALHGAPLQLEDVA